MSASAASAARSSTPFVAWTLDTNFSDVNSSATAAPAAAPASATDPWVAFDRDGFRTNAIVHIKKIPAFSGPTDKAIIKNMQDAIDLELERLWKHETPVQCPAIQAVLAIFKMYCPKLKDQRERAILSAIDSVFSANSWRFVNSVHEWESRDTSMVMDTSRSPFSFLGTAAKA